MKVVCTNYKHFGRVLVDDGHWRAHYNIVIGDFEVRGVCVDLDWCKRHSVTVSPSLPKFEGYVSLPAHLIRHEKGVPINAAKFPYKRVDRNAEIL